MRTTRAYIASAGTASVLLGSALVMLVLVSTFVAFGSWPGTTSGKDLDQLLLNDVAKQKPAKVAVGADAVRADRRAQTRRVAVARAERAGPKGARGPASDEVAATTPSGTAAPTTAAGGGPVAAAPGGSSPAGAVREQAKNVTQNLNQTTQNVGTQVGNTVDQTTQQVGQVVDQVVGGVQQQTQTTVQQVQDTTTGVVNTTTGAVNTTTDTVKSTTGSLLGH